MTKSTNPENLNQVEYRAQGLQITERRCFMCKHKELVFGEPRCSKSRNMIQEWANGRKCGSFKLVD